jgi:hypothetical protein
MVSRRNPTRSAEFELRRRGGTVHGSNGRSRGQWKTRTATVPSNVSSRRCQVCDWGKDDPDRRRVAEREARSPPLRSAHSVSRKAFAIREKMLALANLIRRPWAGEDRLRWSRPRADPGLEDHGGNRCIHVELWMPAGAHLRREDPERSLDVDGDDDRGANRGRVPRSDVDRGRDRPSTGSARVAHVANSSAVDRRYDTA